MTNEELVALIKQGNNQYCEQLYNQNRGLIYKYAKKFSAYAELDDLMQEGYIALMKAVKGFDASLEYKFTSYLTKALISRFSYYCAKCKSTVHIPPNLLIQISELQRFRYDYIKVNEQEPTESEYMKALGLTKSQLDNLLKAMQLMDVLPLNKTVDNEEKSEILELISDGTNFEDEICNKAEVKYIHETILERVKYLPELQGDIICKRYFDNMTQQQIAENHGCSYQYVSDMEKRAKRNLKHDSVLQELFLACYDCYGAYHYTVGRFKDTRMSATEYVVERKEQLRAMHESSASVRNQADDVLERYYKIRRDIVSETYAMLRKRNAKITLDKKELSRLQELGFSEGEIHQLVSNG